MPIADSEVSAIPETMHAAVYRGRSAVQVEEVPTPRIGAGEILIRVEACGICHTDLKKIELNTCLKAVVECAPQPGEFVAVLGQGPIGLMFTMLVKRSGARIASTDTIPERLLLAARCGAEFAWDPRRTNVAGEIKRLTGGRGADLVIVAASVPGIVDQAMACSRPGARILLFAQTSAAERVEVSGADICVSERTLFGCYSASVDLQRESANLVFGGELPLEELISHRLPLAEIRSGIDLALHPGPKSLKIIVQPQRWL